MHKGLNAHLLELISTIEAGETGAGGGAGGGTGEKPPAETPPAEKVEEQDPPGADQLGDAGKRALDAMKAERKAARDEAAQHKAALEALQARVAGQEAEHAAKLERDRVQADALAKANEHVLRAELRAAAAGKLTDPEDALLYIGLDSFEVGDNYEIDRSAVVAKIDELVTNKPYLAAQGGARFQGGADGGARTDPPGKSIQEQIAEAEKARDIGRAIRLRQQLAADIATAATKK